MSIITFLLNCQQTEEASLSSCTETGKTIRSYAHSTTKVLLSAVLGFELCGGCCDSQKPTYLLPGLFTAALPHSQRCSLDPNSCSGVRALRCPSPALRPGRLLYRCNLPVSSAQVHTVPGAGVTLALPCSVAVRLCALP